MKVGGGSNKAEMSISTLSFLLFLILGPLQISLASFYLFCLFFLNEELSI